MNIRAPAPQVRGATGIPVNRQSLTSRWAFFSSFFAIAIALTCISLFSNTAQAQTLTPQGRLTLVSQTPVMTSDVVGASTIYYTPYVGNSLPISNGTSLSNGTFSELSLSVSTADTQSGHMADIFAIYVDNAFQLCILSQWASTTSRGSGAAQLTQLNGIWVNANDTTQLCGTPTTNYDIPAKQGIYLGSVWTSTHPASTDVGITVQFNPGPQIGGSNNLIGLWNAYNRVGISSLCADSNSSWTYSTSSWEMLDGSTSTNSISFVEGWKQSFVDAELQVQAETSATSVTGAIGLSLDGASPVTGLALTSNATFLGDMRTFNAYTPQLGFHTISGQQWASGSTVAFSTNGATAELLKVELDM